MDPARTASRQQQSLPPHRPSAPDANTVTSSHHHKPHSPHTYNQPHHPSYHQHPPPPPPYAPNGHINSASPATSSPVDARSHAIYGPPPAGQSSQYTYQPATTVPPQSQPQHRPPPLSTSQYQQSAYRPPTLAPIHDQSAQLPPFAGQVKAENQPVLRPPSGPHSAQEAPRSSTQEEYKSYGQRNGSGHAVTTPVNQRAYSHELPPIQHPPASPALTGPYSAGSVQEPSRTSPRQMDHGPHHGYPPASGIPHHLPPPQPPHHGPMPPMHPPPHPHDQNGQYTPVMDPHAAAYHGQPQTPVYQQQYAHGAYNQANAQKRRPMRAQQACDQCRQRKQKCDEGQPCSFCREQHIPCNYRDTPPVKVDKNTEKIMHQLEVLITSNEAIRHQIRDQFSHVEARLSRLESSQPNGTVTPIAAPTAPIHESGHESAHGHASESTVAPSPHRVPPSDPGLLQFLDTAPRDPTPQGVDIPDDDSVAERKALLDGIRDHRTAPHKLLTSWPTVANIIKDSNVDVQEDYVFMAEDRGILRIHGRGEGAESQNLPTHTGPDSPARSDDSSEALTPAEGIWKRDFTSTPSSEAGRPNNGWGGVRHDGTLDLDQANLNECFARYFKHIHIMHPFLDKARTRKLFEAFMKQTSPSAHRPGFVAHELEAPRKRQRTEEGGTYAVPKPVKQEDGKKNVLYTEHTAANAVIWLILALGKICMHNTPLQGIVPDKSASSVSITSHRNMLGSSFTASPPTQYNGLTKPSPVSPKSTPLTQRTPPEVGSVTDNRSRRSSVDYNAANAKNLDNVPGLAYYSKAAEIMGDHMDGNELVHVQMFLLAALYKGQLGRVKESMSALTMAGRGCQMLVETHKLYRPEPKDNSEAAREQAAAQERHTEAKLKDRRIRLVVMASWTCLQLESDILAEMKYPSSGIGALESVMCTPFMSLGFMDEDSIAVGAGKINSQEQYSENNILSMYVAQLFLRRRLNNVHNQLYGDQLLHMDLNNITNLLESYVSEIEQWRRHLSPEMKWSDNDEPADDILRARLRAKYYGAKYIINRVYLDYAMHIMPIYREGMNMKRVALDSHGERRDPVEGLLFSVISTINKDIIWQRAKDCIDAAMHSTVAFDNVSDRLIVTNIHGTAHAQFGNMLVMAAVYHNEPFREAIGFPVMSFRAKLDRTIGFLQRLAPILPTSVDDCLILRKIQLRLFPSDSKMSHRGDTEPLSATNSFSH